MCIPEIDLKSITEKLLLDEAKEKLCKKKEHPLQSCEKVYWPDGGRRGGNLMDLKATRLTE